MSEYQTWIDFYSISYPAVDACVADLLDTYSAGAPVPLLIHWRPLSAGSAEHRVTDVAGNEVLRAVVRLLPDDTVTIVNLQATNPSVQLSLQGLLIRLQQIVVQHQAKLNLWKERGAKIFPALRAEEPPEPPPPPRRGDKEQILAVLIWYDTWNPRATMADEARYCRVSESTVKRWRNVEFDRPKRRRNDT